MIIILTIVFFLIDLGSKILVNNSIDLYDSIKIIDNFFYITYVRNTGAAWSMFAGNRWMLVIVSLIIIVLIILYMIKNKPGSKLEKIGYSMILGGSIGNLFDRIVYGYVIDFFDFYIFGYDYPIFNLADSFILVGVLLLVIYTWRCKDGN